MCNNTPSQDTTPGTVLLTVEVTDRDIGANAYITLSLMDDLVSCNIVCSLNLIILFSFSHSQSLFSLESGELRLAGNLDYDDPSTRVLAIAIMAQVCAMNILSLPVIYSLAMYA